MCFYVRSLCLLWRELHALCSSSCCDVEYNVIITFLHTHTQKKKNCTCYVRLVVEMGGSLH
jgi:hypothetical protein